MKAIETYSGQKKRYGDYFREWDIETEKTDFSEVLSECKKELCNRDIPLERDWLTNIRGDKSGDMSYYFGGYCKLVKKDNGWHFTVGMPYAD